MAPVPGTGAPPLTFPGPAPGPAPGAALGPVLGPASGAAPFRCPPMQVSASATAPARPAAVSVARTLSVPEAREALAVGARATSRPHTITQRLIDFARDRGLSRLIIIN